MSQLVLKFKDKILGAYSLIDHKRLTIGRHRNNDIVIDNLAVSGYHARVDAKEDGFVLTDLQSKNGTYVNHDPITEVYLKDKDIISIGKHALVMDLMGEIDLEIQTGEGVSADSAPLPINNDQTMVLDASPERQPSIDPAEPDDTIAEHIHPKHDILCLLRGGDGELELSRKPVSIGINDDADIVVTGLWSVIVGGPAATISKQAGNYILRYVGGFIKPKRNGVSVKGTVKLNHDDIVDIGPVRLQIQLSQRILDQ